MDHFYEPGRSYDDGKSIREHHFVVFEKFIRPSSKCEGDEEKEEIEGEGNNFIGPSFYFFGHNGNILQEMNGFATVILEKIFGKSKS